MKTWFEKAKVQWDSASVKMVESFEDTWVKGEAADCHSGAPRIVSPDYKELQKISNHE